MMTLFTRATRALPFLRWPRPTPSSLRRDAWAGISVGLVLVPQSIAYAALAGMPVETGLYAALIPSVIGVLWGSSALLAVGPVALTSLLVFGALSPLATPGTAEWVVLAIWLSFYTGAVQLLLGLSRMGAIANLVSQPVLLGFVNAAAVIIIGSQLPALTGMAVQPDTIRQSVNALLRPEVQITFSFGVSALVLLFALRRFWPRAPGILIVTVLGIIVSEAVGYSNHGGSVVGSIPSGLPSLSLPLSISFESHRKLWSAALIVALISFTEAMSSCRILARRKNDQWDENQELVGQGLAKIASGFSGSFPVSGSFSRSALNLYVGATSAWSTLFSVACVLGSLFFLTGYLYHLPQAILAAIIIVPVLSLIDLAGIRHLFKVSPSEGGIAVVTFLVTLAALPQLYWGVAAGVGLSLMLFMCRSLSPRVLELVRHTDGRLRNGRYFSAPRLAPDVLAVRIDAALNFLSAAALERFIISRCTDDASIRRVLLCAGSVNEIDTSGISALESLVMGLDSLDIELYACGFKRHVWCVMERTTVIAAIGSDRIFGTESEAVSAMA